MSITFQLKIEMPVFANNAIVGFTETILIWTCGVDALLIIHHEPGI
jgi:hypothetical protein